jgi:transcriptional regulator with XRE-family HTH domain
MTGETRTDGRSPPLPGRLRELREAKGMSRAALADASGVPYTAIENIERGRTPTPGYDTFLALAKALGVSPAKLAAEATTEPTKRKPGRPRKRKETEL